MTNTRRLGDGLVEAARQLSIAGSGQSMDTPTPQAGTATAATIDGTTRNGLQHEKRSNPRSSNTATSLHQAWLSKPGMGRFDPNVAPFIPQQPQQYAANRYDLRSTAQEWPHHYSPRITSIDDTRSTRDPTPVNKPSAETSKRAAVRAKKQAKAQTALASQLSGQISTVPPQPTAWLPRRSQEPRVFPIPKPSPTMPYLKQAYKQPGTLLTPRPLLVILDLNGTLLCRKNKTTSFVGRPGVEKLLEYLFRKHTVMVWSSARPENVHGMCEQLFTPTQQKQLAGVWTRDMLRLGPHYHARVQVYKQLSWVWDAPAIQATAPAHPWDQSNTVLIDDSLDKAASEPFNLIEIDEFERRPDQMDKDTLGQVADYLEMLRLQENVSAYMQQSPFRYDPAFDPMTGTVLSNSLVLDREII